MLGPNGAGKTTALRALAGLTPLSTGHLRLDGVDLRRTPPESRPVGVVFQDYLLFPHLTALDNVASGRAAVGAGRTEARARAAEWLDRMGLAEHADAKPRRLSGGQSQRVPSPVPWPPTPGCCSWTNLLAALDARTRLEVRARLRRHLAAFEAVAVLVTHDPAGRHGARTTVWSSWRRAGSCRRARPPTSPATRAPSTSPSWSALNLYRGQAEGHTVRLDAGPGRQHHGGTLSGPAFVDRSARRRHPVQGAAGGLQRPQPLALRGRRSRDPREPDPRGAHRRTRPSQPTSPRSPRPNSTCVRAPRPGRRSKRRRRTPTRPSGP
ncbi:hypothetical protein GCM10023238_24970 [Streptomyces heliomycini]